MPTTPQTPPRPTHARGPKVRAAVLSATILELAETGYADLTMDAVAKRAGVHKTTVYRRWPDRDALIADALAEHVAADVPIPDTGTVEGDLRALALALVRWLTSPVGYAVSGTMVSGAGGVPGVDVLKQRFFADRYELGRVVVARAVERGELPGGTDPVEVLRTLIAPIYLRRFVTAEPLDEAAAESAVRVTLAAARAGALT